MARDVFDFGDIEKDVKKEFKKATDDLQEVIDGVANNMALQSDSQIKLSLQQALTRKRLTNAIDLNEAVGAIRDARRRAGR